MLHTLDPHSTFLTPEGYREMNTQTSGAFGGLGIVISVRDQQLTVIRPMPDTPASRAGIKRFDRIVKIEGESTLTMPLDDAVKRLRGDPDTKVTLWLTRDGEDGFSTAKPFELTREVINVSSVASKLLDGNIGYIKLKSFQSSSMEEVDAALASFREKGDIKGLVLDLRGNPGGLLDQAVKIADRFVSDGVIVATQGASEGREERKAVAPGTEPDYPMVVLTSGTSASASEILRGRSRTSIAPSSSGSRRSAKEACNSFFPNVTEESAALKLTISQYLNPASPAGGDVSIQGVGVSPDVELEPMTVDDLEMNLMVHKDGPRERELPSVLSNDKATPAAKPEVVVRYQYTAAERDEERESSDDDDIDMDFPVRFGRDLAAAMPEDKPRLTALKSAMATIDRIRTEELTKVAGELSKDGIDWSAPPEGAKLAESSDLEVKYDTGRTNDEVTAGQPMDLKVTVKNKGAGTIYRLHALTDSENGYFDSKELAFGKIGPGEEKVAKVPLGWCTFDGPKDATTRPRDKNAKRTCKIPMDASERSDGVSVRFDAEGGSPPPPLEVRTTTHALPRPTFKYAFEVADDREGNGDGRLQRGEKATMYLTVKNVGPGRSYDTQALLTNVSGDDLLLHAGRFDVSNMQPGDVRRVAFTFDVADKPTSQEVVFSVSVSDLRSPRIGIGESARSAREAPSTVTSGSGHQEGGRQRRDAPRVTEERRAGIRGDLARDAGERRG